MSSDYLNSEAMAVSLTRDFQVPPDGWTGQRMDTFDNARNSAVILRADNVKSILLVTSSTHMLRATREFLAAGLEVTPAPVHVLGPRSRHRYCRHPKR